MKESGTRNTVQLPMSYMFWPPKKAIISLFVKT